MSALACPASLKGVLSAREAAAALRVGFERTGVEAFELPVADGGEGTCEALHGALGGEWQQASVSDPFGRGVEAQWLLLPDGTAVVEAAAALGLPLLEPSELDPLRATSRGLGELIRAVLEEGPAELLVGLGGVATVDGGVGMRPLLDRLGDIPVTVACDVRNPLLGPEGAAQVFGPQKGADAAGVRELERRLAGLEELRPYAQLAGAGAAGGLGACLASLGATLVPGAELVLGRIGFVTRAREAEIVVTGEGTVDRTTFGGKAPGDVWRACKAIGTPCIVFGGIVAYHPPDVDIRALSGLPHRAAEDLIELAGALL